MITETHICVYYSISTTDLHNKLWLVEYRALRVLLLEQHEFHFQLCYIVLTQFIFHNLSRWQVVSDKQLFSHDLLFTITFILYHSQYSFPFLANSKNFIKHKQKAHLYPKGKFEGLLIKNLHYYGKQIEPTNKKLFNNFRL